MIEAIFKEDNESISVEVKGHAGGKKGEDLICAGVSSVLQMFEIGINGALGLKKKFLKKMGI